MMSPFKLLPYLRTVIKDYNFWPASESDSPLKVIWRDGSLSSDEILKIDASARKAANEANTAYQFPLNRTVSNVSFDTTFQTQIATAIANVTAAKTQYDANPSNFPGLETSAENLELLTQLYSALSPLSNNKVTEVAADSEAYVTVIISGEWTWQDETITVGLVTVVTRT